MTNFELIKTSVMPLSKENELAHKIIGYSIEIHKVLGPGLNKEIYHSCLKDELTQNQLPFRENLSIDLQYKSRIIEDALVADLLVENCVAVIIDGSENLSEVRVLNLVKILRESNIKLGLIINFNASLLKNGIRRVTNHKLMEALLEQGQDYTREDAGFNA